MFLLLYHKSHEFTSSKSLISLYLEAALDCLAFAIIPFGPNTKVILTAANISSIIIVTTNAINVIPLLLILSSLNVFY